MSDLVLAPVRPVFRALAEAIVPETSALEAQGWADVEGIIEEALATRPPIVRRQLRVLIRLLNWMPVLRHGRRFVSLDPARRAEFLKTVQDSRLLLLRRGFWGLRTLTFMGYYARPEAAAEIGYRADPRGWEARR